MTEATWDGCYDDGWKGIVVEGAFAHPAKFARGLVRRIYSHMLAAGYVREGDTILDPFGGVALGAMDAMTSGLRWVGCELEPRFVKLGRENLDLWAKRWGLNGAVLLQGDSRRLCDVVRAAGAVVCSPPYANSMESWDKLAHIDFTKCADGRKVRKITPGTQGVRSESYGQTPGQLGSLPAGDLAAVVTSPPYVGGGHHADQTGSWNTNGRGQGQTRDVAGYGQTAGQLGQLQPGEFGAVVGSPPYMDARQETERSKVSGNGGPADERIHTVRGDYGTTSGQLGHEPAETFWAAARLVVRQCFAVLRPGAVAVWVTKDYVKNRARVPFSDQWRQLCEAEGFTLIEWARASLVREWQEATLFGDTVTRRKERKSFFRRLQEKKGAPRIDFEDVLILRRPAGTP